MSAKLRFLNLNMDTLLGSILLKQQRHFLIHQLKLKKLFSLLSKFKKFTGALILPVESNILFSWINLQVNSFSNIKPKY